jgi:hypothetical protein
MAFLSGGHLLIGSHFKLRPNTEGRAHLTLEEMESISVLVPEVFVLGSSHERLSWFYTGGTVRVFQGMFHSNAPLVPTPARLKRIRMNQWRAPRVSNLLPVAMVRFVQTLKAHHGRAPRVSSLSPFDTVNYAPN